MVVPSFHQWDWRARVGAVITTGTALVMAGNLVGAAEKLAPYVPASRGYVQSAILARSAMRDVQVQKIVDDAKAAAAAVAATASTELKLAQAEVQKTLTLVMQQQFDIQGAIYEGQLSRLRAELVDLEISLKDRPSDLLILRRKAEVVAGIEVAQRKQQEAECQSRKAQGMFASGC